MDIGAIIGSLASSIYFDYGLVVLVTALLTILIVPGVIKKGAPSLFKSLSEDAELNRMMKRQTIEIEKERVEAMKKIAEAVSTMATLMARFDVRLVNVERRVERIDDKMSKKVR